MTKQLAKQLIEQAQHLARKEPRKPKQASLRRAVSAAYYALFHFLVDLSCRDLLGTTHGRRKLRHVLARAFSHRTMKNASKAFAGGTLPANIGTPLNSQPLPPDIRTIAETFARLQEERHRADYDPATPFSRGETLRFVDMARDAMKLWERVKKHDAAGLYLMSLLVWDNLKGR